jgi:hypothetical protein
MKRINWTALNAEASRQGLGTETDTTVTHYGRAPLVACGFAGSAPATMEKAAVTCTVCQDALAYGKR